MIKKLTLFIFLYYQLNFAYDKQFIVLIPSYNNSSYYKKNLDSVFNQQYEKYRIIYIDDCSSDNTGNLVEQYVNEKKQNNRFTLIKNNKRQLALANIYKAVLMCENYEIVIILDGDDELANNNVLSYLNNVYQNDNIWITYGNYKYLSNGSPCDYDPTVPEIYIKENKFRDFPHGPTHLRTFYAWLFKQIKIEDLFYEEQFFKMAYDVAIFLPMMEMASERHKFIKEILYIYNDTNPINDHRISMNCQHLLNRFIRQKNKYQRLNETRENFLNENDFKSDLIIFINDLKKINYLINILKQNFLAIEKIYFINDSENNFELDKNEENVFLINKQSMNVNIIQQIYNNIFDNGTKHIIFLDENFFNQNKIDIAEEIKRLELIKAFSLNIVKFSKIFEKNCIEIMPLTYACNYSKSVFANLTSCVICRKQDIQKLYNSFEKLSLDWRYIGWNKICLFKFIENN